MDRTQPTVQRAKACNTCRRKKTKCDGKRPTCAQCAAFGLACGFRDVWRAGRGTGSSKKGSDREYVAGLEERVRRLEGELQRERERTMTATAAATAGDNGGSDVRVSPPSPSPVDEGARDHSPNASDLESYVINTHDGKMRFFGASSGLSTASTNGARLLHGQTRLETRHAHRWQLASWYPRILRDGFERREVQHLPSKAEAEQLAGEYFRTVNQVIPLFDEGSFMRQLHRQYSWNPDESPSWWISLNVVLGMSYRERAQGSSDGGGNLQRSLGHVKNALNVVVELFMRTADLSATQGLLGLAIYFQSTPNPQPVFMFVAMAMRLAQSMGLHRANTSGASDAEVQERRRTFWVAFALDADISIRTGRPSAQDVRDFDAPLPARRSTHDALGVLALDDGVSIGYFHLLAQFSLVQRQVHRHLYTATAFKNSGRHLVHEITVCKEALLNWVSHFPEKYRPQRAFSAGQYHSSALQHVLRLHLAYHCCFANLYHICALAPQSIDQWNAVNEDDGSLHGDIAQCIDLSLESARSAIELVEYIPGFGDFFPWSVLYFPAAASVALSSHILSTPHHAHAPSDLVLVHRTTRFLSEISAQEPGTYVDFLLSLCSELEGAASRSQSQSQSGHGSHTRPATVAVDEPNDNNPGTSMSSQGYDPVDSSIADFSSLPSSLAPLWNWQDAMAGVRPLFDVGPGVWEDLGMDE